MTTTMLESFDTQMFDYQNDLDFSMHVSATDSWFQDEAVMEDDGQSLHIHNVEVDMEQYDEDQNEYEMEDGSEHPELDTGHAVDVDLDPAPLSVDAQATGTLTSSPDPTHTLLDLTKTSVSDSVPQFLHADTFDFPQSSHDIALVSVTLPSSASPLLPPSDQETFPCTPLQADVTVAGGDSTPPLDAETVGAAPKIDSEGFGSAENHPGDHAADEEQYSGVDDNVETTSTIRETEVAHSDGGPVFSENGPDIPQSVEDKGKALDEYDDSAGDPHEISEGVYIDPPPAVLLSFPSHSEISLFNTPGADDRRPGLAVLLAHLPTLYYEPVSSVFEAVRQEEHPAILELLDGELVFDAYDLQLTIHEDSIHAREISLHDLNVLHDGLSISGSLRIRIHAVSPRFIVQYHMLQEQVVRLTTADPSEAITSSPALDHDVHETQIQLGNQVNTAEEHTILYEGKSDAEYGDSTDKTTEEPVMHGSEAKNEEDYAEYGESSNNTTEEPATHGPKETTYDKDRNDEEDEKDTEGKPEGKPDFPSPRQGSADHLSLQNSSPNVHEELTTDSAGGDDEQDAIGEEQEEGEEQEDATYSVDNAQSIPEESVAAVEFGGTAENDAPAPADDGYAEYDEYAEHDDLGDGEYGETPLDEDNLLETMPIGRGHSQTLHALELAGTRGATPRLSELALAPECTTGTETHDDWHKELVRSLELRHEISNNQGPSKQEPSPAVSKPDLRSGAKTDDQANYDQYDVIPHPTDTNDEVEPWDNELDGDDADLDATWEIEYETESNQSSTTLSSKMSSKRSISEVELEQEHDHTPSLPVSPGAKRPRIEG